MSNINYFNKTGEEIEEAILKIAEPLIGDKLAEGDERRALIKAVSYFILQLGKTINHTGANNFLRYADEDTLELLGEYKKVERNKAQKARTTIKFVRGGNVDNSQGIPFGTKIAAGNIIFETIESKSFSIGNTEVVVEAECTIEGETANNFLPGQINLLVDVIPFVVSAENITPSSGGSNLEDIENYRQRIQEAPESYSVAGPRGAYKFWAKTADNTISDVQVQSVTPGVVDVYPLLKGGKIPKRELLNKVSELLNRDDIRPFTDTVNVKEPTKVHYDISFSYYISKDNEQYSQTINAKVNDVVKEFINETKEKLGTDINPDILVYKLIKIGVKRVEFVTPVFIKVPEAHVALGTLINATYAGIENE